jgi:hypothetical protein
MKRILVSGSRPHTGKTSLILRMLEDFRGFAVIQVKVGGMFSSVIADPSGDEADLLRKGGAGQVIRIKADTRDWADAVDQALCLMHSDIEGVIIEAYPLPEDVPGDILIYMTDRTHTVGIPAAVGQIVIIDISEAKSHERWGNAFQYPLFRWNLMNNDPDECVRFMVYLRGVIKRLKIQ